MIPALALLWPLSTSAVVVSPVVLRGSLDKDIIRKVVNLSVPAIRQCYQTQLLQEPTLRGELTVHFTITAKGVVGVALIDGPGLSPQVDPCVTSLFAKMRFPAVKDASYKTEIYYPFTFEPPTKEQP